MNMHHSTITSKTSQLHEFILQCNKLGFKNNNSLKAMKFDWCMETGGMWNVTFKNDKIISVSGIHPFKDGFRALFRGAQLEPRRVSGLNRHHMASYPFAEHLPLQLDFADNKPVYITTNISNDASGRMNRIHKSFSVMEKYGQMVEYCGDEEIFYTQQSIWKVNVENYFNIRQRMNKNN